MNIDIFGDFDAGKNIITNISKKNFFFSLIISYTNTCQIPGITAAGSAIDLLKFTSPSDAEFINYGACKNISYIPMTPDGKPTPAIITKTMLDRANIPHITINVGSVIKPQIPYIETHIPHGNNIKSFSALDLHYFYKALDYGKIIGKTISSFTNCLIIGESIPGGTTTALAVLKGLGLHARVSSSMPNNPLRLKNKIVDMALSRINTTDPFSIVSNLGDPIMPFIAGMLHTASSDTHIILAGGTQMAAILAFAQHVGYDKKKVSMATTSYIINDQSANLLDTINQITDIPIFVARLKLEHSKYNAIRSYSKGFVKDGAGAGGSTVAAILKNQLHPTNLLKSLDENYSKLLLDRY